MRKPKTVSVQRGRLYATGATKAEAKANLEKQIDWACENSTHHVEKRFGLILIVTAQVWGFTIQVIDPATVQHGWVFSGTYQYGQVDYHDALTSARNWAAQNAWDKEIEDDEEHVRLSGLGDSQAEDLRNWIGFQRAYLKLQDEYKSSNECFHEARMMPRAERAALLRRPAKLD